MCFIKHQSYDLVDSSKTHSSWQYLFHYMTLHVIELTLAFSFMTICVKKTFDKFILNVLWSDHVSCFSVHRWICSQLLPVCHPEEVASVPEHQEHHPEGLRRPLQRHLRGHLPEVGHQPTSWASSNRSQRTLYIRLVTVFCGKATTKSSLSLVLL